MIDYAQALAIILLKSPRLDASRRASSDALGHVLAEPVCSPESLPPFNNSAMDGFALYAGQQKLLTMGTELPVLGSQAAGDASTSADGGAWEIMTGARMPAGMDTVVPIEQVEILDSDADGRPHKVRLSADIPAGQHVRRCGEDVLQGNVIMQAGDVLQAQHIMLLAAVGVANVSVVRRPRVAIINTGQELVDDPQQPLQSGQIRNSNGPFLAARIAAAGADVVHRQTVTDEAEAFLLAVEASLHAGADVVLSTGAVSMGRYDFVPDALRAIGATIGFHKVRIRPGKPLLFAQLTGGALFFGLPGNPVSSAVGQRFFVEPALRAMLGLPKERPLQARLCTRFEKQSPFRCFLKAKIEGDVDGQLQAIALPGQESFRIAPLLEANAWAVMPEQSHACEPGTLIDVHGLGHLQSPLIGSRS